MHTISSDLNLVINMHFHSNSKLQNKINSAGYKCVMLFLGNRE